MKIKNLHRWNLSAKQAIELQKKLSRRVKIRPLKNKPQIFAGLDCALSRDKKQIIACAVVLRKSNTGILEAQTQNSFELIETKSAVLNITLPYIPGLLSFREAPGCIAAVEKLDTEPDVFLIDGQGIAHPRRLGLAAHLGLFFDTPTIGCAKSRLTGTFTEPPAQKGRYSLLKDKHETIGAVLRTRNNVKPIFVSVGNKCTLKDAVETALACTSRYRIPEPARLAHQFVSRLKLTV